MLKEVPFGLCHCGCGLPTELATKTNRGRGAIVGEPQRFRRGHGQRYVNPNGPTNQRRQRTAAQLERNRLLQEGRDRAQREKAALRKAEQERKAKQAERGAVIAPIIETYRAERAASERRNKERRAAELASVKAALDRANEERKVSQKGGRPRRIVMNVRRPSPDALLNALPVYQGQGA